MKKDGILVNVSLTCLICVSLLSGCEKSVQDSDEAIMEVRRSLEENMVLIKDMVSDLQSAVKEIVPKSTEIPTEFNIKQFLEMNLIEKNKVIKHYVHSRMGGVQLSNYDLYMMVYLQSIFNDNDSVNNTTFIPREKIEMDTRVTVLNQNITDLPTDYIVIYFTQLAGILDQQADIVAIYTFQDELYLSLYQQDKFIQGYNVTPKHNKDMFMKLGQLKLDLMNIQCGQGSDC
ncbi:hypothetical protein PV433_25290 [Paenibacillus sp. GYB004]|uniref:hypothetical protein n=1 Tax=Paenibacillus sp. GYB004 TaxID=2994393 RepID=UPI002F964562